MKRVLLSVIMPVYNGEKYLGEAIESILGQTYIDFEFLIIDDGSEDKSLEIIKGYTRRDLRIKLINQDHKGIVAALNHGIKFAKGKYIARQDADDRSESERLSRQVQFLESSPSSVIVGSSISVMDNMGHIKHQHALLLDDAELRQELLVRSPFAHGSVMFRRESAQKAGLYNQDDWPAEDYDLWLRLSSLGQMANLDDYLYTYREHSDSTSEKRKQAQLYKQKLIQEKAWQERHRLMPNKRFDLGAYKPLDMGQQRLERILDNTVFVSRLAWRKGDKSYALKNLKLIAGNRIIYKKAAGKLRRKIRQYSNEST